MDIPKLHKLARALGCKRPETRVRHNPCASDCTYTWTVSVIEEGQTTGPSFVQESSETPEKAAEFVENSLVLRVKKVIAEHEAVVLAARGALDGEDALFTIMPGHHSVTTHDA